MTTVCRIGVVLILAGCTTQAAPMAPFFGVGTRLLLSLKTPAEQLAINYQSIAPSFGAYVP